LPSDHQAAAPRSHRTVQELELSIRRWVATWNDDRDRCVDHDRRPDPRHHRRLLPAHQRLSTEVADTNRQIALVRDAAAAAAAPRARLT
jgi:hypothetical protein